MNQKNVEFYNNLKVYVYKFFDKNVIFTSFEVF
jgi:hypothetical protein